MGFISYSQNFEDVILRRAFKHMNNGFYVDIGANDPVVDSVTNAFYEMGWRGINVEPVEMWFKRLAKARSKDINLQILVGNKDGESVFFEVTGTGLSTTRQEFAKDYIRQGYEVRKCMMPIKTLDTVCLEYGITEIHFLKIDVEGGEEDVIDGLDLTSIRPWVIVIEATLPNNQLQDEAAWNSKIIGNHYHHVYYDGLNRFYVADEHADMDAAFKLPPNVWDDFETFREYRLKTLLHEVTHSHSWRMTAPLRRVGNRVRQVNQWISKALFHK